VLILWWFSGGLVVVVVVRKWLVVRRAALWRIGLPLENIEAGITVLLIGNVFFFFI